ncbi:S1 family peptidase [Permianibacter aggregans]|uniref:Trypsin-like peptidase n=1 Tax=Permianibacter aggregans TaxID=1510150 RepID=A0A4R6UBU7_9GAMM|nr:serine protease [Permianibacter aggregans]QGX39874.1 serine protease [Permianibacter aggregans]TDQ43422.1 trypsin-like peptidase [Permianibacter aggregans]
MLLRKCFALFALCLAPSLFAADIAQQLYADHQDSIYRIDVITVGSDQKSSLGTGFVIARDDLLASNFHVVSDAVHEPEKHRLEWVSVDGRRGPLKIIAVDVVHDLSLLQAEQDMGTPLHTTGLPDKGTALFSLGHPLGLDLAIVNGSNNGLLEKALYDKIHFSGNINPGMSGGPAINAEGKVVGVNVATAGEAVGFLVPAKFLDELIQLAEKTEFKPVFDLQAMLREQLLSNQQKLIDDIFAAEWKTQTLGKFTVPSTLLSRMDCWGDTDEVSEKHPYVEIASNCSGQDNIFLSGRQRAGEISYQFFWLETETLSPRAFYQLYENQHNSTFQSGANEKDVGNWTCSIHFVELSGQSFKANVCARPYKRYADLTDFMVLMAMTGHPQRGFMFTLDLSAVTLDNGMKLFQALLERFQWQP